MDLQHNQLAIGQAPQSSDIPPTAVCVLIRTMGRVTLVEAVRSALAQTWPHVRVKVVVASGQPLPALAGELLDPRVEIIDGGQCLPRAAAANRALEAADAELALFLDDDDWLLAEHVAHLVQALHAHPEAVAAHAGVECRMVSSSKTLKVHAFDSDITAAGMQLMNRLPIHASLFRVAAVRQMPALRFNESLECFEDWDFWLQLMARGRFVRVQGISAVYRLDDEAGSGHAVAASALRQRMLERFGAVQLKRWTPEDVAGLIEHESAQAHAHQLTLERADGLQIDLDLQFRRTKALLNDLDVLRREHTEIQRRLTTELARNQRLAADYRRLEEGHQSVIASLSWRITAPLRTVRSFMRPGLVRAIAKTTFRALPMPEASKRRARTWLLTKAFGSRVLGWLAAPSAALTQGAPAAALDKEAVRAEAEAELGLFLDGAQRLSLRRGIGRPKVSVIIVLFNQAGLSMLCLRALADSLGTSFETIVVDNASTDRVPQLLERLDGALVLRQDSNLGFLRAVNLAAEHATGEHLLLLNNDAVVEPQTLAHAVARLEAEPDAGAVGGPILLWDGRLQEAGSIIWRDGSCQGHGRGDSPDAPAYRFVRDVDYCSGAFLMVRRTLFEQLGRFDTDFAPAYYEESDLCVRLWQAGHRVVYDPQLRVKHFEFASDTGSGQAMALQARNRSRFVAKHGPYLQTRPEPGTDAALLGASQILRPGARRILIIDDRVPLPELGRGYPRAAKIASIIGEGRDAVTYYPLQIAEARWDEVYAVLNPRTEVILDRGLAGLSAFLSQRAGQFDLILVSRPHNMEPVVALRVAHPEWFDSARIIYDAEALFCLRTIERAKVMGRPLSEAKAQALLHEELSLAREADRIVAVSQDEARQYRQAGCTDVLVLGHALPRQAAETAFDQREGFLFVGAITHDDCPNGDSVLWFVREVWPLIRVELGDAVQLDLVGVCESAAVRALASDSIRIHGRVADLAPFFNQRRVFIVPTRFAAGVPHKAHEAASRGMPMVVTPLIARQLGWSDEVLVADGAAAFARACSDLHDDAAGWQRLRDAALAAVERDCSETAFRQAVREIVR